MDYALTIDYELWGDGSGDVFKEIINPTKQFLDICNSFQVKTTIFLEVVELWKLEEEWQKGNKMGYDENPVQAIKMQIKEAFKQGHDIQLHLHPQWINAKYENDIWYMDNKYWRLSDVPLYSNVQIKMGLFDLIKQGKETLENLLKPINNDYKCNIIRAGGYNITPSKDVYKALKKYEFVMDSSVYPGGFEEGTLSLYDYRSIDAQTPYWYISEESVLKKGESNILEVTIFARPITRLLKFSLRRIVHIFKNLKDTVERGSSKFGNQSKLEKIKYFSQKEYVTFDFCLHSLNQLKTFDKCAKNAVAKSNYKFHPIILIGHSKNLYFPDVFQRFLKYQTKRKTNFITLTQINNIIRKEYHN